MKKKTIFFYQPLFFNRKQGFSLVELLVVIAILGILSVIAIPNYQKYRKRAHESWLVSELAEQSKFLRLAHSVDGGYHQHLESMGYKPHGKLMGNAGFYSGSGGQAPCCDIYGSTVLSSSSAATTRAKFTYVQDGKFATHAHHMCNRATSTNCDVGPLTANLAMKSFTDHGIQNGDCSYTSYSGGAYTGLTAFCNCDAFTLIGATTYGEEVATDRHAQLSQGDGILVFDHKGQLCKADAGDGGKLKPH